MGAIVLCYTRDKRAPCSCATKMLSLIAQAINEKTSYIICRSMLQNNFSSVCSLIILIEHEQLVESSPVASIGTLRTYCCVPSENSEFDFTRGHRKTKEKKQQAAGKELPARD